MFGDTSPHGRVPGLLNRSDVHLGCYYYFRKASEVSAVQRFVALSASGRVRQNWVETVQCLNRCLLVHAEHGGMMRRAQIVADNVGRFSFEIGIVAGHVALRCGFSPASFQTRWTASLLTPSTDASLRQLQCVEPSAGFLRVADRIRARRAGVRIVAVCPG